MHIIYSNRKFVVEMLIAQQAWSGLSSCCGHCWRYDGPDCPPVVDLFLSTGMDSLLVGCILSGTNKIFMILN